MSEPGNSNREMQGFERLLTLWVLLCMAAGIVLGRLAPGFAQSLPIMEGKYQPGSSDMA